jgi:hypothetical protein
MCNAIAAQSGIGSNMETLQAEPKVTSNCLASQTANVLRDRDDARLRLSSWIDAVIAVFAITTVALWVEKFRYRGLLGESDLYWVLNGLLDGARKATYLTSPHHYGKAFSFGYIAAIYHLVDHQTLIDRLQMITLINQIGFVSFVAGCVGIWLLTWSLYGGRSATIAVILFSFSPMMLELGTSGHQILPAFALFTAGAFCLLAPTDGWRYLPFAICGFIFLLAALATRAEIVLAFPFLVLARSDLSTLRRFLWHAAMRSIVPVLAYAAFSLLKRYYIDSIHGTVSLASFLDDFISVRKIPIGVLVMLSGCGIVTAIVGLLATFWAIRKAATGAHVSDSRAFRQQIALGPLALMIPPLAFWIANPLPARHFILVLAGISMLSACMISSWLYARPLAIYVLVAGVIAANQALGALSGPLILRHIPNKFIALPGDQHLLPFGLPVGSFLNYHRTYESELMRTDRLAEHIRDSCDEKTLVLTNREQQILSILYHPDAGWDLKKSRIETFPTWEAQNGNHTVIVLSELGGWPRDAVAAALADPQLDDFKIELDPRAISASGHAVIPPYRLANLDCTR